MSRSSFLGLGPPPVVGGFTRRPDRESLRPGEEVSFEPVGHRGRPGVVRARGKSGPDPASTLTRAQRWEPLREPKVASVNLEAIHDNDDHLADVADVAGEYTVEADRQDWLAAARHQARSHSDDVTSVPHEEARHRLGVDSTA